MKKWFTRDYLLERIPFYKAFFWISLVTFFISGSAFFGLVYYRHIQELRAYDSKYAVRALVQDCCSGTELPTAYFMEVLGLSVDKPLQLYNWNLADGEKQLRASPYIKQVSLSRIPPDTVKVSYVAREPIAVVGDLSHALIDREGYLLPRHPLFTEGALPSFILGVEKADWGVKVAAPEAQIAIRLKRLIDKEFPQMRLAAIDVARAYARSAGKRQIVVVLQNESMQHVLRLTAKDYLQQLANYRALVASGKLASFKSIVIDLRLEHLAYLESLEGEENDGVH